MNKFMNWLFGIKPESKEERDKRVAEINSTLDELQAINSEIRVKKKQLEELNNYLKTH